MAWHQIVQAKNFVYNIPASPSPFRPELIEDIDLFFQEFVSPLLPGQQRRVERQMTQEVEGIGVLVAGLRSKVFEVDPSLLQHFYCGRSLIKIGPLIPQVFRICVTRFHGFRDVLSDLNRSQCGTREHSPFRYSVYRLSSPRQDNELRPGKIQPRLIHQHVQRMGF
jgi:hypothetical protein